MCSYIWLARLLHSSLAREGGKRNLVTRQIPLLRKQGEGGYQESYWQSPPYHDGESGFYCQYDARPIQGFKKGSHVTYLGGMLRYCGCFMRIDYRMGKSRNRDIS